MQFCQMYIKERILKWVFVYLTFFGGTLGAQEFANQSELKDGAWYKIRVSETGLHKISYDELLSLGFSNINEIRIYGNGGCQLSFWNDTDFKDDLQQIPIYLNKGADESFGSGDYLLFYAKGPNCWEYDTIAEKFRFKKHGYDNYAYYFLTTSRGESNEIATVNYGMTPNIQITHSNVFQAYEEDDHNLIGSGRIWFGHELHLSNFSRTFSFSDLALGSELNVEYQVATRAGSARTVELSINGDKRSELSFNKVNMSLYEARFADLRKTDFNISTPSDEIAIELKFLKQSSDEMSYVDYVLLNAKAHLDYPGGAYAFRNVESIGSGKISQFRISNSNQTLQLWDITDVNQTFAIETDLNGSELNFVSPTDVLREFLLFDPNGDYPSPTFVAVDNSLGWVENQDLHSIMSCEMLIVTHPLFIKQAKELADWHKEQDGLMIEVVTTSQVYNEFSSGSRDATAIKLLSRMLFERTKGNTKAFKYLLLFGDGSYDNKNDTEGNTNYIPTYQSEQSLVPTLSYVSDDFYGMLETDEGETNGDLDIGIGRFPVKSDGADEVEAQGVVEKIKAYYDKEWMLDWRNRICFLADDGEESWDGIKFMEDSDALANYVQDNNPEFYSKKIYLDAYELVNSSSGGRYPGVEEDLKREFKKGALIINYMGHGGETAITAEGVLDKTDLINMSNESNFPLMITATCQFGRYDKVETVSGSTLPKTSAAEEAFLNKKGGAIALLTTSRLVYQSQNFALNKNLYNYIFKKDENGNMPRLGDVIRETKNATPNSVNKLNFTLLGDPAIRLTFPEFKVITDSIINESNLLPTDTLSAFSLVSVYGSVVLDDSTIYSGFDGVVQVSVFDKEQEVETNGSEGIPTYNFKIRENLLYKGKAKVTNGKFKASFRVPKDISYDFGKGKVYYYAQNEVVDANGSFDQITLGGTDEEVTIDAIGPEVQLYMNDESFVSGGITDENPVLVAKISDESGINTTGIGIGHNIVGILDGDVSEQYILNDYFEYELDSYQSGTIRYPLFGLAQGYHTLEVKAWDIFNNSVESTVDFEVSPQEEVNAHEIVSYPNPASMSTSFQYRHNQPGTEHYVRIRIFDISGQLVEEIQRRNFENSYVSEPILWEFYGSSAKKVTAGIYPCQVIIQTQHGESILNHKLIIIQP